MIGSLIAIVIICGLSVLALWAVKELGTPDTIARVVRVIVIVVAILLVVAIAASMVGVNIGVPVVRVM